MFTYTVNIVHPGSHWNSSSRFLVAARRNELRLLRLGLWDGNKSYIGSFATWLKLKCGFCVILNEDNDNKNFHSSTEESTVS
jgi:hypothetical protein